VKSCPRSHPTESREYTDVYCYKRWCPADYTTSGGGKWCEGRTQAIRNHQGECPTGHSAFLGVCYTDCKSGFFSLLGFCVPRDILKTIEISVADVGNAIEDVLDFILGLPIIKQLISGIDAVLNSVVDGLLGSIGLDLNEIADDIFEKLGLEVPSFPLNLMVDNPFDIELPTIEFPDVGLADTIKDITNLPNTLMDKALESAPPQVKSIVQNCASVDSNAKTQCLQNEVGKTIPFLGRIFSSVDDFTKLFNDIQSNLAIGLASLLSTPSNLLPSCKKEENVTIDISKVLDEKLGIELEDAPCNYEMLVCTEYEALNSGLTETITMEQMSTERKLLHSAMSLLWESMESVGPLIGKAIQEDLQDGCDNWKFWKFMEDPLPIFTVALNVGSNIASLLRLTKVTDTRLVYFVDNKVFTGLIEIQPGTVELKLEFGLTHRALKSFIPHCSTTEPTTWSEDFSLRFIPEVSVVGINYHIGYTDVLERLINEGKKLVWDNSVSDSGSQSQLWGRSGEEIYKCWDWSPLLRSPEYEGKYPRPKVGISDKAIGCAKGSRRRSLCVKEMINMKTACQGLYAVKQVVLATTVSRPRSPNECTLKKMRTAASQQPWKLIQGSIVERCVQHWFSTKESSQPGRHLGGLEFANRALDQFDLVVRSRKDIKDISQSLWDFWDIIRVDVDGEIPMSVWGLLGGTCYNPDNMTREIPEYETLNVFGNGFGGKGKFPPKTNAADCDKVYDAENILFPREGSLRYMGGIHGGPSRPTVPIEFPPNNNKYWMCTISNMRNIVDRNVGILGKTDPIEKIDAMFEDTVQAGKYINACEKFWNIRFEDYRKAVYKIDQNPNFQIKLPSQAHHLMQRMSAEFTELSEDKSQPRLQISLATGNWFMYGLKIFWTESNLGCDTENPGLSGVAQGHVVSVVGPGRADKSEGDVGLGPTFDLFDQLLLTGDGKENQNLNAACDRTFHFNDFVVLTSKGWPTWNFVLGMEVYVRMNIRIFPLGAGAWVVPYSEYTCPFENCMHRCRIRFTDSTEQQSCFPACAKMSEGAVTDGNYWCKNVTNAERLPECNTMCQTKTEDESAACHIGCDFWDECSGTKWNRKCDSSEPLQSPSKSPTVLPSTSPSKSPSVPPKRICSQTWGWCDSNGDCCTEGGGQNVCHRHRCCNRWFLEYC